jgi:hypothetical protein
MRVRLRNLLKNHNKAFTLFEVVIASALFCVFVWSSHFVYRLYKAMVFNAALDQVILVCHSLSHHAFVTRVDGILRIVPPAYYSVNNGPLLKLPYGICWGVGNHTVNGPPSRPLKKITTPVVGGEREGEAYVFRWHSTGARTPGTLYLSGYGQCGAITCARSARGVVTVWRLESAGWIKRQNP